MKNLITLKEFRANVGEFASQVAKGRTLIVTKRSRPLFRIGPVDEGGWEEVVDLTKIKPGGVRIDDLLARL